MTSVDHSLDWISWEAFVTDVESLLTDDSLSEKEKEIYLEDSICGYVTDFLLWLLTPKGECRGSAQKVYEEEFDYPHLSRILRTTTWEDGDHIWVTIPKDGSDYKEFFVKCSSCGLRRDDYVERKRT